MTALPPKWLGSLLSPGGRNGRLHVLFYHRVLAEPNPLIPGPSPAEFAWDMEVLATHFNVLPLDEGVRRLRDGTLPPRAACVSFDDGFADNLELALPVAQRVGVPLTVFVATRYLNGGIMFNDLLGEVLRRTRRRALDLGGFGLGRHDLADVAARVAAFNALIPQIKYRGVEARLDLVGRIAELAEVDPPRDLMLDDAGVRALHRAGVGIGAHTHSHPILAVCDDAEARAEIVDGKRRLAAILDAPVPLFAYPNGKPGKDYLPRDVALVREAGFEAAFSTTPGAARRNDDVFELPRFTPWDRRAWRFVARLLRNAVG